MGTDNKSVADSLCRIDDVSRRDFLFTSGAVVVATTLSISGCGFENGSGEGGLGRALVSLLDDTDSAKVIGLEYIELVPDESSSAVLIQALIENTNEETLLGYSGDQLREWVLASIQADFSADRSVLVERWLLSATECRLCALSTIIQA